MVIRLRHMIMGIAVIAALVSVPLLTVWKKVYIREIALQHARLSDSLTVVRRDTERVRLVVNRLAATDRIESFARSALGLEYPSSDRIHVVTPQGGEAPGSTGEFLDIVKRSFSRDDG